MPSCSRRAAGRSRRCATSRARSRPAWPRRRGSSSPGARCARTDSSRTGSRPYLRFGGNTLKKYGEPSDPGVVLGRDDVWFVDVGPLWRNHECDYAETFAVGDDPERHRLVRDVRAIFDRTSRHWREARATGVELYRFAAAEAAIARLAARPRDGRASPRRVPARGVPRWPARRTPSSRLRRGCGCSKSRSATRIGPTAPSSRTCCSKTPTFDSGARTSPAGPLRSLGNGGRSLGTPPAVRAPEATAQLAAGMPTAVATLCVLEPPERTARRAPGRRGPERAHKFRRRAREPRQRRRAALESYPAAFTAWISSAATFCASP